MSIAPKTQDDFPVPTLAPRPAGGLTPPYAALRAFDALGRTGSLRRAARELCIDHAAISRHVRALESWLGVLLIERRQSGGALTPEGERYHRRVSAALRELNTATAEIMSPDASAPLKVWCVAGLASQWLASRLGLFRREHPDLDLEVQPTQAKPHFAAGEADADIRYLLGRRTPASIFSGVKWVELCRPQIVAVASPGFLAGAPPIGSAADLAGLPLLHKKDDSEWRGWLESQGLPRIRHLPGPRLWYSAMTLGAARSGQGVALTNIELVRDDLSAGLLAVVEVGEPMTTGAYFFTTRADRWGHPPLVKLRRWLQQEMAA